MQNDFGFSPFSLVSPQSLLSVAQASAKGQRTLQQLHTDLQDAEKRLVQSKELLAHIDLTTKGSPNLSRTGGAHASERGRK